MVLGSGGQQVGLHFDECLQVLDSFEGSQLSNTSVFVQRTRHASRALWSLLDVQGATRINSNNATVFAIQKFTIAAREEKEKRRAELEALKTSKNDHMPAAQSYFTEKAKEDKAKRDAENQRLKENPVMTAAGAHFAKAEEQKKAEAAKVKEAPVVTHAAGEHFNKKAKEEKERIAEAAKQREGRENPNLIATDYFARKEKEEKMAREESIRIAREAAKEKSKSVEPLPADYFTKQNEARLEAEKQAALDGLKDAPIAVRSKSNILYSTYSVSIGTYTACI